MEKNVESPQIDLQRNAIEILPNVIGIISKPKFFPIIENEGTFNRKMAPVKPNNTKTTADIRAFSKVVSKVASKDLFPNKSPNSEKLIPNRKGSNNKRVTHNTAMVSIFQRFVEGFTFIRIKVFFLFQSVL